MKIKLPDTFESQGKFEVLVEDLGIKTTAGRIFLRIALENALLMDGKQQDYGSKNISAFGTFGIVVRMNDKLERLKNLKGLTPEVQKQIKQFIQTIKHIEKNELTLTQYEIMLQINDSFEQIKHLFSKRRRRVHNESIIDSFRDTSNYANIAIMTETKSWPNE